jgi:hypothetical protein
MKKIFLLILFLNVSLRGFSGVIKVQNTNDSGIGSLRQAVIDANNGDSITFNPSLLSGGNNKITLTSGEIAFNKDLTIIGLITATDTLFLSGNKASRIFNITGGTTTLDRMVIVDGYTTSQGGGIKAYFLTINNSIVRYNNSSGSSNTAGGGIYAFNLTINNSIINNNTASSTSSSAYGAGVFSNFLTINNSIISGNIATAPSDLSSGGGINASNLTIYNSVISDNAANGTLSYGGGVYVSGTFAMTNSVIKDNMVSSSTSSASGGGIYAYASSGLTTLTIDNSTFSGNTAQSSNTASAYGGAIYTRSNSVSSSAFSTLKISYSTFVSNAVSNTSANATTGAGAGIYANNINLTIDHSLLTKNITTATSYAYGGAIYATSNNSPSPSYSGLTLKNSVLSENSAVAQTSAIGGGIYVESKSISNTSSSSTFDFTIDNSIVSENLASTSSGNAYGGGIYSVATASQSSYYSKINATINNSTISGNIASASGTGIGGGIYGVSGPVSNFATSNFSIINSTISANAATGANGGAAGGGFYTIASGGGTWTVFNLSFNHSTIYGNEAVTSSLNANTNAFGGGIVCGGTANSDLSIINSTVNKNVASSNNTADGGGIHISSSTNFTIGSSIVAENEGDNNIFGSITTNNGYNIFDDVPVGTVISDQTNVNSSVLNLGPLQNNGGSNFTVAPNTGSVAIDMGNPSDVSDAQNGAIIGLRDVGAAEFGITACPTLYDSIVQTICYGDTYNFGGKLLTSSGMYKDTIPSVNGCDSVITLSLTVSSLLTGVDTQTACESYTWIDGNTYTANNTLAKVTLSSINGCDSVVTLYLIIKNKDSTTDTKTACGSYTWIDGNTYISNNNTATHTLLNLNGCDSVVTLNLTITNSESFTDSITACDSYTWIDGNAYTANNTSATHTYTNLNGCLVTATLNLIINKPTTGTDTKTACSSYTWIDGNTYTANNNTATFNIVGGAANNCDSLVTLNLTINRVSDITTSSSGTVISANNTTSTYQWLDCDNNYAPILGATGQSFTATANGNYAVELNENGCLDTSSCVSITTVDILQNNFRNTLVVFPNPTEGNFVIDLGENYNSIKINITDLNGKLIHTNDFNNSQILSLNILAPAGVYFLTIISAEQIAVIRIIKK